MHQTPPLDPPDVSALPWYGADRAIPPSRFLPGLTPHPDRRREGGHVGRRGPDVHEPWAPEQWATLQAYLRGIDLFNRWYFWEAHEAWEPLWRSHPPQSDSAWFIQGLISTAAALLKLQMGNVRAARTLSTAACERLASFRGIWMGLAVEAFRTDMDRYLAPANTGAKPDFGPDTPRIRLTHIE